jgi:hypothetical protein
VRREEQIPAPWPRREAGFHASTRLGQPGSSESSRQPMARSLSWSAVRGALRCMIWHVASASPAQPAAVTLGPAAGGKLSVVPSRHAWPAMRALHGQPGQSSRMTGSLEDPQRIPPQAFRRPGCASSESEDHSMVGSRTARAGRRWREPEARSWAKEELEGWQTRPVGLLTRIQGREGEWRSRGLEARSQSRQTRRSAWAVTPQVRLPLRDICADSRDALRAGPDRLGFYGTIRDVPRTR